MCNDYSSEGERDYIGFKPCCGELVVPVSIVRLSKPEVRSLKQVGRCPWKKDQKGRTENIPWNEASQKSFAKETLCGSRLLTLAHKRNRHHSRWNIFSLEYSASSQHMARTRIFGNASHLSGLLGEENSSYALGAIAEVSAS